MSVSVKDNSIQSPVSVRPSTAKNIFVEVLLVAIAGAGFAFAANQISPRGLALTQNYFPAKNNHTAAAVTNAIPAALPPAKVVASTTPAALPPAKVVASTTPAALPPAKAAASTTPAPLPPATVATNATPAPLSPAQLRAAQIKENGLQLVDVSRATNLFLDPRFKQNGIVFIDARDESHYQEGHIPGAYEFDLYHPDKYFAAIFPICQTAEQIVVYCNGGDCDDSEKAAVLLRNVGIANQKLFIYEGGITEWTNNSLPVETGARNSGNLRGVNK